MKNQFMVATLFCVGLFSANMLFNFYEDYRAQEVAEQVSQNINQPNVTVKFIGNTIVLEGTVNSEFQKDRATEIAKAAVNGFRLRNLIDQPKVLDMIEIYNTVSSI